MRCSCGLGVTFTPSTVVGPAKFDFAYLLLVNCSSCGSTRAAVLWEAEEESEELPIAAE